MPIDEQMGIQGGGRLRLDAPEEGQELPGLCPSPRPHRNTIRVRRATACVVLPRSAHSRSRSSPAPFKTSSGSGRPSFFGFILPLTPHHYFSSGPIRQDTRVRAHRAARRIRFS